MIDTAPTGHTLLLLDVTGAFHRQVMHDAGTRRAHHHAAHAPAGPDFSRLVLVALAETTPVAEAAELQDDLRRAGIEPFGLGLNAILAGTGTADPVLRARARLELPQIARVSGPPRDRVWLAALDPQLAEHDPASSALVG